MSEELVAGLIISALVVIAIFALGVFVGLLL
jgi:hypothetical protein